MRNGLLFVLLSMLFGYLLLVIFCNRALFFSRFDVGYWQDKYEQSHWKLPLSRRVIGDDGLYLYEGYRLLLGKDPSSANAEMPPLGKYLIGTSIVLFGNGYIYGFLTTAFLIIATYHLAKKLLGNALPAAIVALLLTTDPLITNQFALTMMDALQAFLGVLFFLLLFSLSHTKVKNRLRTSLVLGIILGLFSAVKLPLFTPLFGGIGLFYIWFITRQWRSIVIFMVGCVAGYLTPYGGYFIHGHSIIEWLKLQKWMISFYHESSISPNWGSSIATLVTGYSQNLFSHLWERSSEWTPSWGLLLFLGIAAFFARMRHVSRSLPLLLVAGTTLIMVIVYAVIPFWTRYFVLLLPFLYIVGVSVFLHRKIWLVLSLSGIMLLCNLYFSFPILFPPATNTVHLVMHEINNKFFADLYEHLTDEAKKRVSRNAFREQGMTLMDGGEIEQIRIDPRVDTKSLPTINSFTLEADAIFFTRRLGKFAQPISLPFVREQNRWKIDWRWDLLIPGYSNGAVLETTVIAAKRGAIRASDKKPLAEDIMGATVWVTPMQREASEEARLLDLLETIFGGHLPKVALHQRIVGNTRANIPIAIGVMPHPPTDPNIRLLSTFRGVSFTPTLTRVTYPNNVVDIGTLHNALYNECCSYLYATNSYDGISGVEKIKNTELKGYNGGRIVLKDAAGNILNTWFTVEPKNGTDVQP